MESNLLKHGKRNSEIEKDSLRQKNTDCVCVCVSVWAWKRVKEPESIESERDFVHWCLREILCMGL